MYKKDLALDNLQRLMCHKNQLTAVLHNLSSLNMTTVFEL